MWDAGSCAELADNFPITANLPLDAASCTQVREEYRSGWVQIISLFSRPLGVN